MRAPHCHTIIWSSVEGGTYRVEASDDLASWTVLDAARTADPAVVFTSHVDNNVMTTHASHFYRVGRTALATYDNGTAVVSSEGISTVSPVSGNRNASTVVTITLNSSFSQAPPPTTVAPSSITLTRTGATTITGTSVSRNSTTGIITATFVIQNLATPGSYSVNATFGPNTWSLTNGFTVN